MIQLSIISSFLYGNELKTLSIAPQLNLLKLNSKPKFTPNIIIYLVSFSRNDFGSQETCFFWVISMSQTCHMSVVMTFPPFHMTLPMIMVLPSESLFFLKHGQPCNLHEVCEHEWNPQSVLFCFFLFRIFMLPFSEARAKG